MEDYSFNWIERNLAYMLSSFPNLKGRIKYIYKLIQFEIYRKKYRFLTDFELIRVGDNHASFFGYYDSCPESFDMTYVAYHESHSNWNHLPSKGGFQTNLIVKEIDTHNVVLKISNIRCGNWQQGLRLTWLSDRLLAYNDFRDGKLHSIVVDVEKQEETRKSPYPHQEYLNDGRYISIDYRLLNKHDSSYGYGFVDDGLRGYGLVLVDMNKTLDICSITTLRYEKGANKSLNELSSNSADHWVNHVMANEERSRIIFIHRFTSNGKRLDRLFSYTFSTNSLDIIVDSGMVSHCAWLDNSQVVGFMKLNGQVGFWRICIETKKISRLKHLGRNDGHPSYQNGRLLYDSYPNRAGMQILAYADLHAKINLLGQFLAKPRWRTEYRCDLHPRWSRDGKSVYFDSTHEGHRALYKLILEDDAN